MLSWIISAVLHIIALLLLTRVNILKSNQLAKCGQTKIVTNITEVKQDAQKLLVETQKPAQPVVKIDIKSAGSTISSNQPDAPKAATKEDFIKDIIGK